MGRILLVTIQQALRSVALTLFPLSFIALFAWSTAGSATGNTSDPIRAAIWLWLGSHLIPFEIFDLAQNSDIQSGALSYLPLGAAIFPWLAVRSGYRRASEFLDNPRGARSFIIIWYTAIAIGAAYFSQSSNIKPNLLLTPIFILFISASATIEFQSRAFDRFKLLVNLFLALLGLVAITISITLALHFEIVKSLAIVIQPGIMGGILFTVLQVLYLPNIILAGLSYLFGFGFSVGTNTQISPFEIDVNSLPAIPVLGALPTTAHPLFLLALAIPIAMIALNQRLIFKNNEGFKSRHLESLKIILPLLLTLGALSYFAGGTLLTQAMAPFGITWWHIPAIFAVSQAVILILALYIPKLVGSIRAHIGRI